MFYDFRSYCSTAYLALLLSVPAFAKSEFPRPPLCSLQQAKSQDVDMLEQSFRSEFCAVANSDSCSERWMNGKQFLRMAITDSRVVDVGTISYMFGTIYAETEINNFSPDTIEKIGSVNKRKDYVKDGYYGRGWIQLTHKEKYKLASEAIGKDFISNPDLALLPENAYEILFRGMADGLIEVYRTSINGAVAKKVPIKLSDFVSEKAVNFDLARAVINANCKKEGGRCNPPDIEYREGLFIPSAESLDAGYKAAMAAKKMEKILCKVDSGER